MAKTLAWGLKKPLVGVNHMEGHALSVFLGGKNFQLSPPAGGFKLPWLILLVSGGHTQLVLTEKWLKYKMLGETRDDAAGEAFDKVAKMLGLGYPGGAKIEQLAKKGNVAAFNFPRPMMSSGDYDFSFSGLKTAVKNTIEPLKKRKKLFLDVKADVAASFQEAVIDVLVDKTIRAAKEYNIKTLVIGGGVSANKTLCVRLEKTLKDNLSRVKFLIPEKKYTNDNAAMIALAGYLRRQAGAIGKWEKVRADAELKLN
jgi:N6-L-threonylcarbamoyladenine synthase